MRPSRALVLCTVLSSVASAQWDRNVEPFAATALIIGAQGFARPPITSPVASLYAHLPVASALLGAQAATTFSETRDSRATYAVVTLGYAQRRALGWQVYPFVGAGGAYFRTQPGAAHWKPAMTAGFGLDVLAGPQPFAPTLGARIGYVTRSLSDDASIAYAAVGVGFGGRIGTEPEPRNVARAAR